MYIALVGWLFREFDISRIELDCKNCKSYKVFLWATEWMKTTNATKITKIH